MASMALFADSGSEQNNRSKKRRKTKVTVTQNDNSADEENSDATSAAEYTDLDTLQVIQCLLMMIFLFKQMERLKSAALLIPTSLLL